MNRLSHLPMPVRLSVGAVALTVLVLLGFTVHGFVLLAQRPDPFAHLTAPPPGPRAPAVDVLGLAVGETSLAQLRVWLAARDVTCVDASSLRKETAPAHVVESATRDAPATSCPFKMDAGVQVRLSCEVDPARLGARFADSADAELTFVFDSADHPLRYVMIDRKLMSQRATHAEWTAAVASWQNVLGAPTAQSEEPSLAHADQKAFPRFKLFRQEWRYSDRRIEVQAMNFGPKKGIDVREVIEIPWPIRSM